MTRTLRRGGSTIGRALTEILPFVAARPGSSAPVAEAAEWRRSRPGRSRDPFLKPSLGGAIACSAAGEFAAALPWFERAGSRRSRRATFHGRIDHGKTALCNKPVRRWAIAEHRL